MRFMNHYDIDIAQRRYSRSTATPNRYAAALTIAELAGWANRNSDGWAYWPKPCRAAARLMELLEGDGTNAALDHQMDVDATDAEYAAALRPVKAFLTRQGVDHAEILRFVTVEPARTLNPERIPS